jgi:hypothetical protein
MASMSAPKANVDIQEADDHEPPDIAVMPIEEAVRYLVETFGTDEHDARELVLVAHGELTNDGFAR